jgi:hypothetical protein
MEHSGATATNGPSLHRQMLCLRQFAFPHNTLVRFACTLDAIFELPPIVRKLLGHNVGPARHIATDCAPDVHGLSNLEFVRRHRTSMWAGRGANAQKDSYQKTERLAA